MQILIPDIPQEGFDLNFSSRNDSWFQEMLSDALAETYFSDDAGEGHVFCDRHDKNVDVNGSVTCSCHPLCSRCSVAFPLQLVVPIHLLLAPLYDQMSEGPSSGDAEVELVKEDLEFSFYEGNYFNLGHLIREQVILAMPLQPLCKEDCKGLCPKCGADMNLDPCGCKETQTDPRFSLLKEFKPKHS